MSISTTITADQAIAFIHDETDISWSDASGFVSAVNGNACQIPTGVHITSVRRVSDGIEVTRHTSPCVTSVHICRVTGTMTKR